MILADAAPIAVYPTLAYLGFRVLYRVAKVLPGLNDGIRVLIMGIVILAMTIIMENIFYGFARISRETYTMMTWAWPMVLTMKVGYLVGHIIMLVGFGTIMCEQYPWRTPVIGAICVYLASLGLLLVL